MKCGGGWMDFPMDRRVVRLGEVADVNWGDTKTTKASYVGSGFLAFSASGPDGFLPWSDFDRVGIVLSAIGAACGKTWLAKGKWSCIKNTIRFFSTDPEVDTEYLYWATRDPATWPQRGSAQPFISQGDARNVEVLLPSLSEQRGIAAMLGALDDKIESNRRSIELASQLLDALAVEVESSLPLTTLANLVDAPKETVNPSSLGDTLVDHYSLPAFDAHVRPERVTADTIMSNKQIVPGPSILLSRLNPRINRTWWVRPDRDVPALSSTEFLCIRAATEPELAAAWLALRTEQFCAELLRRVTGTSGSHQRVRPDDVLAIEVPDVSALPEAVKQTALSLLEGNDQKLLEIAHLAALRDALLPELLSGRIRIPETQEATVGVGA
jgi:type I restriction enzyme S subunit